MPFPALPTPSSALPFPGSLPQPPRGSPMVKWSLDSWVPSWAPLPPWPPLTYLTGRAEAMGPLPVWHMVPRGPLTCCIEDSNLGLSWGQH